jgi:hypothetical protein
MKPLVVFLYHEPSDVTAYHLRCIRESNPEIPVLALCGQRGTPFKTVPDTQRFSARQVVASGVWPTADPWESNDQHFYDWWLQGGSRLEFDRYILIEYDTLVRAPLEKLFLPGVWANTSRTNVEFSACTVKKWPAPWGWWDKPWHLDALPNRIYSFLRGVVPFTGILFHRAAFERAFIHLLHDPLFSHKILHNEMRLATAMAKAGAECVPYENPCIADRPWNSSDLAPDFCHAVKEVSDSEWEREPDDQA